MSIFLNIFVDLLIGDLVVAFGFFPKIWKVSGTYKLSTCLKMNAHVWSGQLEVVGSLKPYLQQLNSL